MQHGAPQGNDIRIGQLTTLMRAINTFQKDYRKNHCGLDCPLLLLGNHNTDPESSAPRATLAPPALRLFLPLPSPSYCPVRQAPLPVYPGRRAPRWRHRRPSPRCVPGTLPGHPRSIYGPTVPLPERRAQPRRCHPAQRERPYECERARARVHTVDGRWTPLHRLHLVGCAAIAEAGEGKQSERERKEGATMRCSAWASFDGGGGRPLGAGSTGGPSSWWLASAAPTRWAVRCPTPQSRATTFPSSRHSPYTPTTQQSWIGAIRGSSESWKPLGAI